MAKNCPNCNFEMDDNMLNCPSCGTAAEAPQPVAYCPPQPTEPLVPLTSIKEFLKFYWLPVLLNMVTCGIGGTIMIIVWACTKDKPVRRNYACSILINMLIGIGICLVGIVISLIIGAIFGMSMAEIMQNSYYY